MFGMCFGWMCVGTSLLLGGVTSDIETLFAYRLWRIALGYHVVLFVEVLTVTNKMMPWWL